MELIIDSTNGYVNNIEQLKEIKIKIIENFKSNKIDISENIIITLDLYFNGEVRFLKHMLNVYKTSLDNELGWLHKSNLEISNNVINDLVVGQYSLTDIFDYELVTNSKYLKLLYISNVHNYLDKSARQKFVEDLEKLQIQQSKKIYVISDGAENILPIDELKQWIFTQEYRNLDGSVAS